MQNKFGETTPAILVHRRMREKAALAGATVYGLVAPLSKGRKFRRVGGHCRRRRRLVGKCVITCQPGSHLSVITEQCPTVEDGWRSTHRKERAPQVLYLAQSAMDPPAGDRARPHQIIEVGKSLP
jgi:hypothetical protein